VSQREKFIAEKQFDAKPGVVDLTSDFNEEKRELIGATLL
jgi:hypothetical protein